MPMLPKKSAALLALLLPLLMVSGCASKSQNLPPPVVGEKPKALPLPSSIAGIEPPPPPVQPPPADPRPVPTPTADLLRELMPAETPQHVREGIMRSFDETEETPKPRRVTDPAEAAYAWVARDGTYWTCRGFMDHKASAHGVAEALGMSLARWKDNAEHALGEMGWAKVGRTAENEPFAWIDATKTPTDAQFDAVAKWLIHYKADPLDIQTWADSRKRPE